MDELTIKTIFTRGLIKNIIRKIVKKKLGVDLGVDIHDLKMTIPSDTDGHNVKLQIAATVDISKNDLYNLITNKI